MLRSCVFLRSNLQIERIFSLSSMMIIFVCVQPCSTTLFGVPFPLPTPQGAGIGNSGTSPRPRFEGCARQPSGQKAHSANLFRKECQGCNEARKPSCPAPQLNLPRRLSSPSHDSADRRLRPVTPWTCFYLQRISEEQRHRSMIEHFDALRLSKVIANPVQEFENQSNSELRVLLRSALLLVLEHFAFER
jgi:hypothetical protein